MISRMFPPGTGAPAPGPLGKLLTYVLGGLLLVGAFMFSLVVVVLAGIGVAVWLLYFWWKTRKLRRAMAEHPPGGHVIDGEAVIVEPHRESTRVVLPDTSTRHPDH